MIAASGVLVVVAFITLIAGVFRTGLELIWVSIAASVLAALFLALGVVQGNKRRIVPATGGPAMGGGASAAPWSDATITAVIDRGSSPAEEEQPEPEPRPSLTAVPPIEDTRIVSPKPASRQASRSASKPAAKAPPTSKAAAKSSQRSRRAPAAAATVVVVPDRDKFHKETCRYAKNPAAMTLTKAQARRQGYSPCATCKP